MTQSMRLFLSYLIIKTITLDYFVIKKILRENVSKIKFNKVLDLGCGVGSLCVLYSFKKYLGIDNDLSSIECAKRIHPKYVFLLGDATALISKKKFDLIMIVGVLHHLSDDQVRKTLKVIDLILTRTGKVIIIEAIPPIFKFNIVGRFLRWMDRGHFVRKVTDYGLLIGKRFKIEKKQTKFGGVVDYGFFLISKNT